jgi:hypothetical protein
MLPAGQGGVDDAVERFGGAPSSSDEFPNDTP